MTERTGPSSSSAAASVPPSSAQLPEGHPHKQALFDAAVEVMRRQAAERSAEREAEQQRRLRESRVSPIVAGGLTILLGIGAYVAVEKPTWLFSPPPVVESRAVQEASLRIGLATMAQRVERFRVVQGRLPRSLSEMGPSPGGIVYEQREGDRYLLRGTNGPVQLTLSSTDSLTPFVGNSFHVLAQRSHR